MVAPSQCLWYIHSHWAQELSQIKNMEMFLFHLQPNFATLGFLTHSATSFSDSNKHTAKRTGGQQPPLSSTAWLVLRPQLSWE